MRETTVLQVGPVAGMPGGMASVIAEYLTFALPGYRMRSYPTYFPSRRLRGLSAAVLFPVWFALRHRKSSVIVHVHLSEGGSFVREGLVVLWGALLGLPVVASLHGAEFDQFAATRQRLVKAVLARCRTVLCLGPVQAQLVAGLTSRPDIALVFNPVAPVEGAPTSERESVVLFGGEVGPRKGIDRLLAAWPAVVERIPDARLVICGPLVTELGALPPSVSYEGTLSRDVLRKRLGTARVACLPSRREVLPMFILEALAAGSRVVATKAGEWRSFDGARTISWVDNAGEAVVPQLARALVAALVEKSSAADQQSDASWLEAHASARAVGEVLRRTYLSLSEEGNHV